MNINERMAKVMGWEKDMLGQGRWIMSRSKDGGYIDKYMLLSDWRPDTSIIQAMMCAEKIILLDKRYIMHTLETYISRTHPGKLLYCSYFHDDKGKWHGGIVNETPSLAICNAILEAMEVKDE